MYRLITKTYYFQRFCNSNIYTSVTSTLHIKPDICYKIRIYKTFTTTPTLLLLSIISNKILNSKHFYLQIYSKFNRIIMKCGQNVVIIVFNFFEPRRCNSTVVGSYYILINFSARTDAFYHF